MSHTIRLSSIKCVEEINESSASEEPYVLVTAVQLRKTLPGFPSIQNVRVFRYGVWEDFDEGEVKDNSGPPFWGLNSTPEDITDLNEVSFIVSLIENDNADPGQYQTFLETVAAGSLALTLGEPNSSVRFARLLTSIRNALNGIDLPIPFALDDDHIGTEELKLDSSDLIPLGAKDKSLTIESSEGHYELTFQIIKGNPLPISQLFAIHNQDGRIELFAIGATTDRALWHRWQTAPNGPFADWHSLGGNVSQPFAIHNQDGRIEVFAIGSDGAVWHRWQTAPNGPFADWHSLGGNVSQPFAIHNQDGRIELLAVATDNALWHRWQVAPNGPFADWQSLGGPVSHPFAIHNQDRRIEVFAVGTGGALWHRWQTAPNGPFAEWSQLD
jgi:hypothetical protein